MTWLPNKRDLIFTSVSFSLPYLGDFPSACRTPQAALRQPDFNLVSGWPVSGDDKASGDILGMGGEVAVAAMLLPLGQHLHINHKASAAPSSTKPNM